jgi:hypothetical protein
MRMGRVLALVAGALALCIAVLLIVVFVTRDEDNLQADNLLAERFTRAVQLANENTGGTVDLHALTSFDWDHALLVASGTSREAISKRVGSEWTGIDTVDGGDILIFMQGDHVVRFADYRGRGEFKGFQRPFAELPPVLRVSQTLEISA